MSGSQTPDGEGDPPAKKRKREGSSSGKHHIRPGSRGGSNDRSNLAWFAYDPSSIEGRPAEHGRLHNKHHTCAGNRTNPEYLGRLALWSKQNGSLNESVVSMKIAEAFVTIYGGRDCGQARDYLWNLFGSKIILRDLQAQLCGRTLDDLINTIRRNLTPPKAVQDSPDVTMRLYHLKEWDSLFCGRPPIEALVDLAFWECADGSLNKGFFNNDLLGDYAALFGRATHPRNAAKKVWQCEGADVLKKELARYLAGRSLDVLLAMIRYNLTPPGEKEIG